MTRQGLRIGTGDPFFVAALLALFFVLGAGLATGAVARSSGSATFADPAGDAQGGPDITTLAIDGDSVTGKLTLTVTAAGYLPATADGRERDVLVWLDSDSNRLTGDPADGTDYELSAQNDSSGRYWDISHWDGSQWQSVPQSATMGFTRNDDVLTWTMNTSDLGGATSFRFYAVAGIWDVAAKAWSARDDAPDGGAWWDYALGSAPSPTPTPTPTPQSTESLKIDAPETTPASAIAGKQLTADFTVYFATRELATIFDVATGTTRQQWVTETTFISSGKLVASASAAGRPIAAHPTLKNGTARLSFLVPRAARGKLLKVRVKVTATDPKSHKTLSASRVATLRVK